MKYSKNFVRNTSGMTLLALGISATLLFPALGGVVVDTGGDASQQQEMPAPKDYAKEAGGGSAESYDVIPPLQNPAQLFPSYPGNAGQILPTPPTYLDPNAGGQNLPMAPTGQAPFGGGMTGSPMTGVDQGMMPGGPMDTGGSMGTGPMMPSAPTPGQNLNQLGIADPQYGRFESARLEASLMPHQATQMNAARNQVIRGGKPFSGYRQPPAYSPYMSLMRNQDTIRGINNYYEFVLPQVEQEQKNKQVSNEISGLQSTARSGYEAIQQIKQRPGNAPVQSGGLAPATFMNTGGYFGTGKQ